MITDAYAETDFEFFNLGISGNRTEHLVARLENDFIALQPDLVILMIGVNDVWHHYSHAIETTHEAFENNLRQVLSEIKAKTPAKILMIEPYLLPAEDKANMLPELDAKIRIERRLAREYADAYLPLHGLFAAATVSTDYRQYSGDGVHPNADGAAFIAQNVLTALIPLLEQDEQD